MVLAETKVEKILIRSLDVLQIALQLPVAPVVLGVGAAARGGPFPLAEAFAFAGWKRVGRETLVAGGEHPRS